MREVMSSMTFSTAGDEKVRHASAGRWNGSFSGPSLYGGLDVYQRTIAP